MDKSKKLFEEFPPVSTPQWEEQIMQDLKGADYEKKLIWKTTEGLKVKPYYRSEDLEQLAHMQCVPGKSPFARGNKTNDNDWEIRQDFEEADVAKANAMAVNSLKKGACSVGFNAENITSAESLKKALKDINISENPVHFFHSKNYSNLLELLTQESSDKNALGSFNFDPLGYFLLYNKFYQGFDKNIEDTISLIKTAKEKFPKFHVININGQNFHNAGAVVVQELAFTLAQANEYLAALTEKGLSVDDITPRMRFTIAIGSNYFLEIAKIRALRILWGKIVEQYKPSDENSQKAFIHGECSTWNKTIYDPYVNMLRTTTEAMSAAIGGIDSFTVTPFDETFKKSDDFSYRIARNQQIILKEEAYFNKVVDPSAGSYYIENLTEMIAEATWKLFVEVETQGGFIKSVESGFIKNEIEKTCQQRDIDIAMRKQAFVGTNIYPNTLEKMIDKLQPTAKLSALGGLRQYRGTQAFEALRLAVENHAKEGFKIPSVFLFTYGNPAMRKARAGFASGFFGVVAYDIIDNNGFKTIEEGVKAAIESKSEIVVLCSSDEEYAEMAAAATMIKEKAPNTKILVAGNPTEIIDQLKTAGVDGFIHMKTNVLDALTNYNEKFGI
ncbi:MAG: methylmalonyl-CoA mutase small subunit [Bacteroidetes bacterium]|nr:methylmalonyl-CoA mutase small subunit [Bacteroidota bacterium]